MMRRDWEERISELPNEAARCRSSQPSAAECSPRGGATSRSRRSGRPCVIALHPSLAGRVVNGRDGGISSRSSEQRRPVPPSLAGRVINGKDGDKLVALDR